MTHHVFDKLAPGVQQFVHDELKWQSLRAIQAEAIESICNSDQHLLLSAATASGKTEAAFLPIISELLRTPREQPGIRAVYISPLKALINNQFMRLGRMCEYVGMPIHRWHGDVSATKKRELVREPDGLLLITPESIESLFCNHSEKLESMFAGLQFVVIDEIHAFMGNERGTHLRSLLSRLDDRTAGRSRKVGLSATIGDLQLAVSWLCLREHESAKIIKGGDGQALKLRIYGYLKRPSTSVQETGSSERVQEDDLDVAYDLYDSLRGTTNLVFGNAKAELEIFADRLNRICTRKHQPNEFLVHHGSLSKSVRADVEERMQGASPYTTFCSNTLELGIDIGQIDSVAQLDPPPTVSALRQRLGRSGRGEGQPSVLRFFVREEFPDTDCDAVGRLFPRLTQSVAMVELIVNHKWSEPVEPLLDYSTFIQQLLSVLKQYGGISANGLFRILVRDGVFRTVDVSQFKELLRALHLEDIVEQIAGSDDLILGMHGERIVNHYEFYAAFQSGNEFKVVAEGENIGSIDPFGLLPGDHLVLAGQRWAVVSVENDAEIVVVQRASGAKPPRFSPSTWGNVHRKVRKEMLKLLESQVVPRYLDSKAAEILQSARRAAQLFLVSNMVTHRSPKSIYLLPWTGDRIFRTLLILAKSAGLTCVDRGIGNSRRLELFFDGHSMSEVKDFLHDVADDSIEIEAAITQLSRADKYVSKYDHLLPDSMLNRAFLRNSLDTRGAAEEARWLLDRL